MYIFMQPHLNDWQARWLEQLAKFDLKIAYVPGKENVAADILSRYGNVVDAEHVDPSTLHSLADPSAEQAVWMWLAIVDWHIDFASSVAGAISSL